MKYQIRQGSIAEAVAASQAIPEFHDPHAAEVYENRLSGQPHLILIAEIAQQIAGFKVGYERDGYFYSWMGGVLPTFRRYGLARALAEAQEDWARQQGYTSVTFKTRNRHRAMLLFALRRGFQIIGLEAREDIEENRILLKKLL